MPKDFDEIIIATEFDKKINERYRNKTVNVPNTLLKSGKKSNLLDAKIDLLSNYKLLNEPVTITKEDISGNEYEVSATVMTMKEINELMPRKGNSLYSDIAKLQIAMQKRIFIYRDPETKKFQVKPLYLDLTYENGKLMIQYNPDTMGVFLDLTYGYTKIPMDIAMGLTTNGGFQLYKILREYTYKLPKCNLELSQEEQEYIIEEFNYDDFRLQMGVVDLNNGDLSEELAKRSPSMEQLNKLDKKARYKRWSDFYNTLLLVGIKEINSKTDIYILSESSEDIRIPGAHNKTQAVRFKIMHNLEFYKNKGISKEKANDSKIENNSKKMSDDELDLFIDRLRDIAPKKMSTAELKSIAAAGKYNYKKIDEVFNYISNHIDGINNVVGACIDRLKNDYPIENKNKIGKWAQMELNNYKNYEEAQWREYEDNILSN